MQIKADENAVTVPETHEQAQVKPDVSEEATEDVMATASLQTPAPEEDLKEEVIVEPIEQTVQGDQDQAGEQAEEMPMEEDFDDFNDDETPADDFTWDEGPAPAVQKPVPEAASTRFLPTECKFFTEDDLKATSITGTDLQCPVCLKEFK